MCAGGPPNPVTPIRSHCAAMVRSGTSGSPGRGCGSGPVGTCRMLVPAGGRQVAVPARRVIRVISLGAKIRSGGPQKPVPRLV